MSKRKDMFKTEAPAPRVRKVKADQTFVQRRSSLVRRIWRRVRAFIPITLLATWGYLMWLYPALAQATFVFLRFAFQLLFAISFMIVQFVALFWFISRTRQYEIYPDKTTKGLRYDDYRGQPELLERARQVVFLLQGVRRFEVMGGEPLTGMLLEGPPGTGKTRLAQVISSEAGVPFFYLDGSSLTSMFMGVGPMKVMRLFSKARKAAKEYGAAIVFIDEIDSIGASRGGVSGGGVSPGMGMGMGGMMGGGGMGLLTTLLTQMSGFQHEHGSNAKRAEFFWKVRHLPLLILGRPLPPRPNIYKRVLVMGATNRVSVLDPALLRPGRFDKSIRVGLPTLEGRKDIINYYLDRMAHDDTINVDKLAQEMSRFSPADIKHILNDSLRVALFDDRDEMTYKDILQTVPEFQIGLRQPIPNLLEYDRVVTAYHEAGHAVMFYALKRDKIRIARLTIVSYGGSSGHASPASKHEIRHESKTDLENGIRISFGGRAAEEVFLGDIHTGAGSAGTSGTDLNQIFGRLLMMAETAMLDEYYIGSVSNNKYDVAPEVIKAKFEQLFEETKSILIEHSDAVEALVEALLDKDELEGQEVEDILEQFDWPPITEPPGVIEGRTLGRHYVERVLQADNGFYSLNGQNGRVKATDGEGEEVPEPSGD